jgi:hypothetical protein
MLMPVNRTMRTLMQMNSQADAASRTFQIQAVIPGSYLLTAFSNNATGTQFAAERPVEIGPGPPDPVQISLRSGTDLKGSVQFDSDDHPAMENARSRWRRWTVPTSCGNCRPRWIRTAHSRSPVCCRAAGGSS